MPLDIGRISGGSTAYIASRVAGASGASSPDSVPPVGGSTSSPAGAASPFRYGAPLTGATALAAQEQGAPAPGGGDAPGGKPPGGPGAAGAPDAAGKAKEEGEEEGSGDPTELTEEEQDSVDELKARDTEVRRHEQAHAAVGGQYAGSPSYEYTQGPDGNRYATGGEVSIDASPVPDDPQATILKMQIVKAAALAPGEPSSQDRRIAAVADQRRAQAQAELSRQSIEELTGQGEDGGGAAGPDAAGEPSGGGAGPASGPAGLFSQAGAAPRASRGSLIDASL